MNAKDTTAAAALAKAQAEMGAVIKNAQNPHLKNKYADLGAVIDACGEALHDNGFAILQPIGRDEHGPYVDTVFLHASGAEFRSRVHLIMGKSDMQALGSAITYGRRYGLLAMAGLAPEDDDGHATRADSRREEPPKAPPRPLAEQMGPQPSARQPVPPVPIAMVRGALLEKLDHADSLAKLEQMVALKTFEGALERLHAEDREGWMEVCGRIEAQREALRPLMPDDGLPDFGEPVVLGEHRLDVPDALQSLRTGASRVQS